MEDLLFGPQGIAVQFQTLHPLCYANDLQAHNLKVIGSNPIPATNPKARDANAVASFFARQ